MIPIPHSAQARAPLLLSLPIAALNGQFCNDLSIRQGSVPAHLQGRGGMLLIAVWLAFALASQRE